VQEREWITAAGFSITGKLKLLGAEISADPSELHCNFVPIQEKIINQINFWSRFKLSLPGRISVAKTFMILQINYLGSVFRPTDEQLITFQEAINNFIRKNLKISETCMYLPPCKGGGGVGFFNIKSFLESQRCMWLLRAQKMRIDNWRADLYSLAPLNNPLLIRASDCDRNRHPILFDICTAYKKFYTAFCRNDSNYKKAFIFENPIFRDPETNREIDINFFGLNLYNAHKNIIRSLNFENCFTNLGFKTIREFHADGLPLPIAIWMRLRNVVLYFRNTVNVENSFCLTIENFAARWKKGGKRLRTFFIKEESANNSIITSRSFLTFKNLIGYSPPVNFNLGSWCAMWNVFSLTNDFRSFIYNSRFNCLPLNNRINAYKQDIDPACTFCLLSNNRPAPRDSVSHCFFYCGTTYNLLQDMLKLTNVVCSRDEIFQLLYWYGYKYDTNFSQQHHLAYNLLFDAFRYVLFKNRLRKILPTTDQFLYEYLKFLHWMCKCSKKITMHFRITFLGTRLLQAIG
jgi:hypothetical protein